MKKLLYPEDREIIEEINLSRGFDFMEDKMEAVTNIIKEVRQRGDSALYKYTEKFDKVSLKNLAVSDFEIEEAYRAVDEDFIAALKNSITNVKEYQKKELSQSWFSYDDNNMTGQLINPLKRVGVYVPGGTAAYPSSVVMTVIPARVAGVSEIVMVSPPDSNGKINPHVAVAAAETGVSEIYKLGGAQAVAALAFGTESIKRVDKIVGPGNIYVTLAKKMVYGAVDIDMLAGPSEVLILADKTADAGYIAADMLSQAEHDPMSAAVFITTDSRLARMVELEIEKQLKELEREDIARQSLDKYGLIIVTEGLEEGIELVNQFAPEHFELLVKDPFLWLSQIKNAGAIFIGGYSPEPLGDYLAGPSHVLPTGGTARFASPLGTKDFLKKSSLIYYQRDGLEKVAGKIERLARLEGLTAHARAVEIRFQK